MIVLASTLKPGDVFQLLHAKERHVVADENTAIGLVSYKFNGMSNVSGQVWGHEPVELLGNLDKPVIELPPIPKGPYGVHSIVTLSVETTRNWGRRCWKAGRASYSPSYDELLMAAIAMAATLDGTTDPELLEATYVVQRAKVGKNR